MKLFDSFKPTTKQDWEKAAAAEVGEGKKIEDLTWANADGLAFQPLYTADDVTSDLQYLRAFDNPLARDEGTHWANMPMVTVTDEITSNAQALDHLQHEADGVMFSFGGQASNLRKLLTNIEIEHCSIGFACDEDFPFESLQQYISDQKVDAFLLRGGVFRKNGEKPAAIFATSLRLLGTTILPSTPVKEVAQALVQGTRLADLYRNKGLDVEEVFRHIAFSIPLGSEVLLDVAKIKALRVLWYQVTQAYGLTDYTPADLYLHGRSEAWINEKFQPHGNMLKSTVAAIAAIGGGCQAITIIPEDESNIVMKRIARNTSTILQEESHFAKVHDPFGGTYAIDIMTDRIAQEAWSTFQQQR
jgi:methylmalonyl-CoA mutase